MTFFSPREIVSELDRFIVGQNDAKRAVAIALRNRWRRQQLPEAMREEVLPKNILMIGPTGVGKTEIARRLARLAHAPFLKVEATKFTEVGYVGRDVEQIVRDLVEISINMTRERMRKEVVAKAEINAEERVLDALVGETASQDTRAKFRKMLREGTLAEKEIEVEVSESGGGALPTFDIPGMPGAQTPSLASSPRNFVKNCSMSARPDGVVMSARAISLLSCQIVRVPDCSSNLVCSRASDAFRINM